MQELLSNLNPQQREAVRHTEGPLLVLAGAGSGKTRVLTYRVAYLLQEKQVPPYNMLAITFTNKAANEMKERLLHLVGDLGEDLWVSTFHAACVRILRREIDALGYNRNFVIYDTADQQILIKTCLKELDMDEKKFPPRALAAAISQAKNRLQTPERFEQGAAGWYEQEVASVYRLYQRKLKEHNALDFDDLIMQAVMLFARHPDILRYYQQKFRYILVDEYQDTNHSQYLLVKMLAEAHHNLCVVGDPDQSIYRWRGADIQNILDFEKDYPEARVIRLEQNYRSTGAILEAANAVIANNMGRKPKKLWTQNPRGDLIAHYVGDNEWAEARFVAGAVLRLRRQEDRSYSEFAVLYRTHAQSRVLEEVFMQEGLPYQILGGQKFYDRKEIKDLVAYLRVILNPVDNVSLQRIVNVPRRGIGEATWARLDEFAARQGISNFEAMHRPGEAGLAARATRPLAEFTQLMDSLIEAREKLSVTDLVQKVLADSGYLRELEQERTPEAEARIENLKEFLSVTQEYDRRSEDKSLEGFLAQVSLVSDIDTYEGSADRVALMTLHTAKGLEFPVVFLVGMEERIFPHAQALLEEPELEEERRLCYVGMTRAQNHLYLTNAWERTLYGNTVGNEPSRFLAEIPPELINEAANGRRGLAWGSRGAWEQEEEGDRWTDRHSPGEPATRMSTAKAAGSGIVANPPAQQEGFQLGDKVHHTKWGTGVIVRVQGEGGDAQLTVAFPDQGLKTLLAQYAPLKKI